MCRVMNSKAIPGEACQMQYRIMCADVAIFNMKKNGRKGIKKIKLWNLENKVLRCEFDYQFSEKMRACDRGKMGASTEKYS